MILVKHILNTKGSDAWSVAPDTSALDALALMAEKDIGAVLVLEQGRLAGVFSERDYARKVILHGRSSKDTPVGALMTPEVVSVVPEDSVERCMQLMTETRCRHLPVVRDESVLGVVSIGDVVKHVISEKESTIRDLEEYITRG